MRIEIYDKQTNTCVAVYENSHVSDQPPYERKGKLAEYFEITYDGDKTNYYSYNKYDWGIIPEQVILDDSINRLKASIRSAKWANNEYTDVIRVNDLVAVLDEITHLRRKLKKLNKENK